MAYVITYDDGTYEVKGGHPAAIKAIRVAQGNGKLAVTAEGNKKLDLTWVDENTLEVRHNGTLKWTVHYTGPKWKLVKA